jgi:hypothetical protein
MPRPRRIDWSDPQVFGVYEDMVSVLLSRLNPEAQRIDGSGGDDGRDVQIPIPGRLEIYELKSFTGRVSKEKGRRRQVANSLKNAAKHNPAAWYLVVPINSTPAEREWFDEMVEEYPFTCTWLDKDWLDGKMALFPELPRYYIDHAADETLDILRELNAEAAAFNAGVSDAIDRLRSLTARFNSLSPHYGFGFSCTAEGAVAVAVTPRYAGAEHDAPISVSPSFNFPDTEPGRAALSALQDSINYGAKSVIPAEYVESLTVDGLSLISGTMPSGQLELSGVLVEGADLDVSFWVQSQLGLSLAHLPMVADKPTRGERGGEIRLHDASGAFTAQLRIDIVTNTLHLTFKLSQESANGQLPAALVPPLAFLDAMRDGNKFLVLNADIPLGPPIPTANESNESVRANLKVATMLAKVQLLTGIYFPAPPSMTYGEYEELVNAHDLLEGKVISGSWDGASVEVNTDFLDSPDGADLRVESTQVISQRKELSLSFGDREYGLGRMVLREYSAASIERSASRWDEAMGKSVTTLTFTPLGEPVAKTWLAPEELPESSGSDEA